MARHNVARGAAEFFQALFLPQFRATAAAAFSTVTRAYPPSLRAALSRARSLTSSSLAMVSSTVLPPVSAIMDQL